MSQTNMGDILTCISEKEECFRKAHQLQHADELADGMPLPANGQTRSKITSADRAMRETPPRGLARLHGRKRGVTVVAAGRRPAAMRCGDPHPRMRRHALSWPSPRSCTKRSQEQETRLQPPRPQPAGRRRGGRVARSESDPTASTHEAS